MGPGQERVRSVRDERLTRPATAAGLDMLNGGKEGKRVQMGNGWLKCGRQAAFIVE